MPSFEEYEQAEFKGKIDSVRVMPLSEHFEERWEDRAVEIIKKFVANARKTSGTEYDMSRDHLIIEIGVGSEEPIYWFTLIPKRRGYNRSNLRKFIKANSLSLNTEEWTGSSVTLKQDSQGFLRVAL